MPILKRLARIVATLALLGLATSAVIGCGAGPGASPANSFVTAGTMKGGVHGGNLPIVGATISLYAAGTSGYGSAGTMFAQTTSNNDASGSFQLYQTTGTTPTGPPSTISNTYACPTGSTTNPDPQMYLIASGGATQGYGNGTNAAAAFAVALGKCSTVSSLFVWINEVSSVGTMAALQQYFNPVTESFGYPNTTQATQGFANGVATIANLVNISTGAPQTSVTHSATPAGATNSVTVTVTPEVAQINLIANILAACVNNATLPAANCTTLFNGAVPPTAAFTSQPTQTFSSINSSNEDTLQALYFMMTNPISGASKTNMNNLFGLSSSTAPFQTAYTTAPTDWTIAVSYASTNACTLGSGSGTTSAQKFLVGVNGPAADASGNIWADGVGGTGDLFAISPNGTPLACGLGTLVANPTTATIDPAGNVWVGSETAASSNYHLYKWNAATSTIDSTWTTSSTAVPQLIVADGNNNIFYVDTTNTSTYDTTSGALNEFAGAGANGASVASPSKIATVASTTSWGAVDSSNRIWLAPIAAGSGTNPTVYPLYDIFPSNNTSGATYAAGTSNGSYTGFELANVGGASTVYNPYGIAVGTTGYTGSAFTEEVFSANGAGSGGSGHSYEWDFIVPGAASAESTASTATITNSAVNLGGVYSTRGVSVDGASNVYEANNNAATGNWVTGATTSGLFSISAISATGTALSATSATGTGAYGTNLGGFQKPAAFLKYGARGIAIDPTGNVWVGQNSSSAPNIMELVGVGVPAVTPLALAAKNGTLGQMP